MMLYYTTRAFPTASRQYEAGDAIDPANITAAEWIKGTESGAVVPARWYGTAAELAARGIPGPGVPVYETDTKIARVGDGITSVASLPQVGSGTFVPSVVLSSSYMDGVTDATVALQALLTAGATLGIKEVLLPAGDCLISDHLTKPHGVKLRGLGESSTRIFAATNKLIKVTGAATAWADYITDLTLDRVGVLAGETASDFGRGLTLRNVEIKNATTGIEFRNNCWLTRIDNCRIHDGVTGVLHGFTGVVNSGAAMSITSTAIFNMSGSGFEQSGAAADGWHVQITNTDIEHCAVSVKLRGVGDGTLDITAGHYELNTGSYIDADSGVININGGWVYAPQAGATAQFVLSGTAACYVNSGRVAWDGTNKLAKVTDTATLNWNPNQIKSNRPYGLIGGATDGAAIASGSSRGVKLPAGFVVAQQTTDLATLIPTQSTTAIRLAAYDTNVYEIEYAVSVTAVGATNNRIVQFYNPGGATVGIIVLPNATGTAYVRTILKHDAARIYWSYSTGAAGVVDTDIAHDISIDKYLDIQNGGDTGNSFAIKSISARVIA